jgi:arginyl-tRNA synthetase
MRHYVRERIEQALTRLHSSGQLKLEQMPSFSVDPPKQEGRGDFSSNVALLLAKAEQRKPPELATLIASALDGTDLFSVQVAGAFLNFTLADALVQRVARDVLHAGDAFGRAATRTGRKLMIEFVSANPTGPLHIGHARGAFVGDALARLAAAAGHDVTREFYVNDFGKQVETLGRTVHKRYRQLFGQDVTLGEGEYPGEYVVEIARTLKGEDGEAWLTAAEAQWLPRCIEIAIRENMKGIRETLARANITHDVFTSEAALHATSRVRAVVEAFRERGATYEADRAHDTERRRRNEETKAAQFSEQQLGGTFLCTSAQGDDEDRVILRKDGSPVYLTSDLAYHKGKFERGFERCIDVWGADHAGHVPRIRAGLRLLGIDDARMVFVLVHMMRIVRDGEEVKLSKRSGQVYELTDLIEEVGPDVCRFLFLLRAANSQFDFDLAAAKAESSDNPVYYFQYGHARCSQILKKAAESGREFVGATELSDASLARLTLPEERALLKKMSLLPDLVTSAAEALEPHRILYFCQELIAQFHAYYSKYKHSERVLSDDVELTQGRLALVAALRQALRSAFGILGISAPDYMSAASAED